MSVNYTKNLTTAMCAAVFLAACGGGGGGGGGGSGFRVTQTLPANEAEGVPVSGTIEVTFSEEIDPTSLNAYTFQVMETEGMSLIEGKIAYDSAAKKVRFVPYSPLTYDSPLLVALTDKIRNKSGTTHLGEYEFEFETQTSPTTNSYSPDNNAANVNPRSAIRIQLAEAFQAISVNSSSVKLETSTGVPVTVTLDVDEEARTIVIKNPADGLLPNTLYRYTITTGVKKLAGTTPLFTADEIKTFTTGLVTSFPNTIATTWDEYADSIKLAGDGKLIVAGETWGAFDSTKVEHYDGDGFIAAVDPFSGKVLDVIQFGSGSPVGPTLEIADPAYDMETIGNSIYVTGFTNGNLTPSSTTANNNSQMYLAKYIWNGTTITASGNPVLVAAPGGDIEGYAITKNAAGTAIYIIGTTTGSTPGNTNRGEDDIVVAKYDVSNPNNLTQVWLKQIGTAARDIGKGIAVDGNSVYITGDTLGDFKNPTLPHVGLNAFVLQLNEADGSVGNTTFDTTTGMTPTTANAIYSRRATGIVAGGGKITMAGTQQSNSGSSAYAMTFTSAGGAPTYAVDGESTSDDEQATGIYLNSVASSVYIAITKSTSLGSTTSIKSLSGTGFSDYKTLDGNAHATIRSMVMDSGQQIYATGYVHGSMNGMMPVGMGDVFVAKP